MPYWLQLYGYMSSSILNTLEREIQRNKYWIVDVIMISCSRVLVFSHFPLSMVNTEMALRVFKKNRVYWHLSGHLHSNYGDDFRV